MCPAVLKVNNYLLCCNLSSGVALIVWFTTNGMCAKNKNICMWREQAIIEWSRWSDLGEWPLIMLVNLVNSWLCLLTAMTRVISSGDLYCCLLPWCEALRACRFGFPIATIVLMKFSYLNYWLLRWNIIKWFWFVHFEEFWSFI